jgi:transcription antitermination factor NusG
MQSFSSRLAILLIAIASCGKEAATVARAKPYPMSAHICNSMVGAFRCSSQVALAPTMLMTRAGEHRMWFAVYTRSHHEKSIAKQLAYKGIDFYLPLYRTQHAWTHRRRVTLDLPLFPNYLFVQILQSERSRVLATEGVVMLVDRGDVISPVPDSEIERLRAELPLRASEPHSEVAVGQKGRIIAGALAGMEGIVLRHKGALRLILTIPLINRSVAVEVNADEVICC